MQNATLICSGLHQARNGRRRVGQRWSLASLYHLLPGQSSIEMVAAAWYGPMEDGERHRGPIVALQRGGVGA